MPDNVQVSETSVPQELREMGEAWARFYANRTPENFQAALKESGDVYRVGKTIQWTWPKVASAVGAVVVALVLAGGTMGVVASKTVPAAAVTADPEIAKLLDDGFKRLEKVTLSSSKEVADELKTLGKKIDAAPKPTPVPINPDVPKPANALTVPEKVEVVVKGGLVKVKASAPGDIAWFWRPSPSFKVDRYADVIYVEAVAEGSMVAVAYTVSNGKVTDAAACVVTTSKPQPVPPPTPNPSPDPQPTPPPVPQPVTLNELGKLAVPHASKPGRKDDAAKLAEVYERTVAGIRAGTYTTVGAAVKALYVGNGKVLGDNGKYWAGFFAWADNELTRRAEKGTLATMTANADAFEQLGAALREASK